MADHTDTTDRRTLLTSQVIEVDETARSRCASCRWSFLILLLGIAFGLGLDQLAPTASRVLHLRKCPRTKIYPFHIGCPNDCRPYRPGLPPGERFFQVGTTWRYGGLKKLRDREVVIGATSFRGGSINKGFAGRFYRLEDELKSQAGLPGTLHVKLQTNLHVSLSYICCLRKGEVETVSNVIRAWNQTEAVTSVGMLRYRRVHCYHERAESVTVIWDVDDDAQRRLMALNRDLKRRIEQAGVPVVIDRDEQMPFHSTVIGFHVDDDGSIEPYLGHIQQGVDTVGTVEAKANIDFRLFSVYDHAQRVD